MTRRFGDFVAVDRVSFRIHKGEIFGFLGSNGCGKSTTMKMLTGLLPPSEGKAELLGLPVDSRDIETRLHIGYMSQSFSLYEELSVRANLDLHARLYRIPADDCDERVAQALASFDIAEVADDRPKTFRLASANVCSWPPPACIDRKSLFSMSRHPASIPKRAICSGTYSSNFRATKA